MNANNAIFSLTPAHFTFAAKECLPPIFNICRRVFNVMRHFVHWNGFGAMWQLLVIVIPIRGMPTMCAPVPSRLCSLARSIENHQNGNTRSKCDVLYEVATYILPLLKKIITMKLWAPYLCDAEAFRSTAHTQSDMNFRRETKLRILFSRLYSLFHSLSHSSRSHFLSAVDKFQCNPADWRHDNYFADDHTTRVMQSQWISVICSDSHSLCFRIRNKANEIHILFDNLCLFSRLKHGEIVLHIKPRMPVVFEMRY